MNRHVLALLLAGFAAPCFAVGIESVELMVDDGGEPGDVVESFAPGDRVQHFKVHLDEMKVGQHEWLVEFWADETDAGNGIKVTDFKTDGLLANTIDAKIELPRDWPIGSYRLDVSMDGEKIGSHGYTVQAEAE